MKKAEIGNVISWTDAENRILEGKVLSVSETMVAVDCTVMPNFNELNIEERTSVKHSKYTIVDETASAIRHDVKVYFKDRYDGKTKADYEELSVKQGLSDKDIMKLWGWYRNKITNFKRDNGLLRNMGVINKQPQERISTLSPEAIRTGTTLTIVSEDEEVKTPVDEEQSKLPIAEVMNDTEASPPQVQEEPKSVASEIPIQLNPPAEEPPVKDELKEMAQEIYMMLSKEAKEAAIEQRQPMTYVEQLRERRKVAIAQLAQTFAQGVKAELDAAADRGLNEYKYKICEDKDRQNERINVYASRLFQEYVTTQLEGVRVGYASQYEGNPLNEEWNHIHYLVFDWMDSL